MFFGSPGKASARCSAAHQTDETSSTKAARDVAQRHQLYFFSQIEIGFFVYSWHGFPLISQIGFVLDGITYSIENTFDVNRLDVRSGRSGFVGWIS